ncbi:MAG TPA: hypothetical protein VGK26_11120 [Thermoanaerobaculia bacterium]
MRRLRFLLYAALAAFGLAVFLVPALTAPVVSWSDSALDLDWARKGEGIVTTVVSPHHPPKPGYILFLRGVLAAGGEEGVERRIVVVQSVLLWLGIAAAALFLGRRLGARYGILLYLVLVLSLRLRDCASAIMSEAVTAAILLPLAALLLDPPARAWTSGLLGCAIAVLFLVRPNAGAAMLLLAVISIGLGVHREEGERTVRVRVRQLLALLFGFAILWAPFWYATRVPGDPFRGMSPAFITGSLDYGWTPPHPGPEPPPFDQVRTALANWQTTMTERSGDRARQLAWRAFHGLLGTDYYDARWSSAYGQATTLSRILAPIVTLCAIAVLLVVSFAAHGRIRLAKILGLTVCALLVAQSLVLGALPRLALPFLPALLLYGVAALPGIHSRRRRVAAAGVFALLVAFVAWQRQVLDWEWGRVEAAGIRLKLVIPRGRLPVPLPERGPATLHVRIAPLALPTGAGLEIRSETGQTLFSSSETDYDPADPFLSVLLPESILGANRQRDVTLTLVSVGAYDATHFLLFPVIPPPWTLSAESTRVGSASLSPETGIERGALDWWAHPGLP